MASAFSFCFLAPSANALNGINISGVELPPGFRTQGAQTTFVQPDPAYKGYPSYQLQPGRRPGFFVGVNIPALGQSDLSNKIGKFQEMYFYYSVPNKGPNVDPNLQIFVQADDGFLHQSDSSVSSTFSDHMHGYSDYYIEAFANQFTPSFGSSKVETVSVQYTNSDLQAPTIYFLYPYLRGSKGTYSYNQFFFQTVNDHQFNN
jgi:hypothetical protein